MATAFIKELFNKYFSSRSSRLARKSGKVEGNRRWRWFEGCASFRKRGVGILKSGKTGLCGRDMDMVIPLVHMGSRKPCGKRGCWGGKRVPGRPGRGL